MTRPRMAPILERRNEDQMRADAQAELDRMTRSAVLWLTVFAVIFVVVTVLTIGRALALKAYDDVNWRSDAAAHGFDVSMKGSDQ